MSATFEQFDARPGGSYRMVLTYADAPGGPGKATSDSDIVEGHFVDIVAGARIVQTVVSSRTIRLRMFGGPDQQRKRRG